MVTSKYECGCEEVQCDVCVPDKDQTCGCGGTCETGREAPASDLCPECGGLIQVGVAEYAAHENGRVLLITDIPAEVCIQCGAGFFSPIQVERMWQQWQSFFTGDPLRAAVEKYIGDADEEDYVTECITKWSGVAADNGAGVIQD